MTQNLELFSRLLAKVCDANLASTNQELLLNAMERKEISAGTMLIKENEEGDEMYVIETGELSVAIANRVRHTAFVIDGCS